MKKLNLIAVAILFLSSCKKEIDIIQKQETSNKVFVTTLTNDTIPSPLYVGGSIKGDTSDIIERGVIYGLSNDLNTNSTDVSYAPGVGIGGYYCPSSDNGKITSSGGTFSVTIQHLLSGVDYYVRAYVVLSSGEVSYGEVVHIDSRTYRRQVSNYDGANVWWTSDYDLFDLSTDEVITPDENGMYNIYYSSNENPIVNSGTYSTTDLPYLFMYKFKTLESIEYWRSFHK